MAVTSASTLASFKRLTEMQDDKAKNKMKEVETLMEEKLRGDTAAAA